jgi:two-component system, response regulator / RNA-binding antiterminator
MDERSLTVTVIGPSAGRVALIEEGLRRSGVEEVVVIPDAADLAARDLAARLVSADPDAVVIELESPSRDLIERMFEVSRLTERPVVMFVDRSEPEMMQAAIEAGVSAYVVDGLKPDRVRSVVDVAILRFNAVARLERELAEAKIELVDRKLIERAKGVLMKMKGISEAEAYALLRRTAMNEKRKIAEVAQALITSAELLG